MNDQNRQDPFLDLVSPEVREEYAAASRGAAALDDEIAVLQHQRRALLDERQVILDMAATDATDDAAIVALRHSGQVGAQRLTDEARALSRHIYDTIEFSATGAEEDFVGPYVSLLDSKVRPLADVDPEVLADALVVFARRFCPRQPETGEYPGMVCGDVMTDFEGYTFVYKPDGSEAVLLLGRSREIRGSLAEVISATIREVQRQRAEAEENDQHY